MVKGIYMILKTFLNYRWKLITEIGRYSIVRLSLKPTRNPDHWPILCSNCNRQMDSHVSRLRLKAEYHMRLMWEAYLYLASLTCILFLLVVVMSSGIGRSTGTVAPGTYPPRGDTLPSETGGDHRTAHLVEMLTPHIKTRSVLGFQESM